MRFLNTALKFSNGQHVIILNTIASSFFLNFHVFLTLIIVQDILCCFIPIRQFFIACIDMTIYTTKYIEPKNSLRIAHLHCAKRNVIHHPHRMSVQFGKDILYHDWDCSCSTEVSVCGCSIQSAFLWGPTVPLFSSICSFIPMKQSSYREFPRKRKEDDPVH